MGEAVRYIPIAEKKDFEICASQIDKVFNGRGVIIEIEVTGNSEDEFRLSIGHPTNHYEVANLFLMFVEGYKFGSKFAKGMYENKS